MWVQTKSRRHRLTAVQANTKSTQLPGKLQPSILSQLKLEAHDSGTYARTYRSIDSCWSCCAWVSILRSGVNILLRSSLTSVITVVQSHSHLITIPAKGPWIPEPRLFGGNPSLDILTRVAFTLSNNLFTYWGSDENRWFLNWLGVSADFKVLRTFFSIKTPTVRATYEKLCDTARHLRRSPVARVLFEIQDTMRTNCPMTGDGINFLYTAVEIGSKAEGMLDIAKRASKSPASLCEESRDKRGQCVPELFRSAAGLRDIPMMKVLIKSLGICHYKAHSWGHYQKCGISFVMHQIYAWDPEELKDGFTVTEYIQLLIEGGILSTSLPASCCYEDRPEVAIYNPVSLTIDELVMMCPPVKRPKLYSAVLRCSNEHTEIITKAGVFTAALEGAQTLLDYLHCCKNNGAFEIRGVLQECLVFAASLNDTRTASALLHLGVDPEVGMLSANQEWYHKGVTSWNPMVIAAAAGSLETLQLLSETGDLNLFLRTAPIFEICQLENPKTKYRDPLGRELRRLENLRRQFMFRKLKVSDIADEDDMSNSPLPRVRGDHEIWQLGHDPSFRGDLLPFVAHKRRIETIAWIRTIAAANGAGATVDKEIIEAALCVDLKFRALQFTNTPYHPCDVLLLDGLVDANLVYHEGDMDLLQLSIRAECKLDVVEFLLSKGLRVHSRAAAQSGNTMLHDALLGQSRDRSEIVHLLLREGADLKHLGDGLTVLEASLQCDFSYGTSQFPVPDCLDIFTHLLDAGAPVKQKQRPRVKEWKPLISQLICARAEDDLILRVVDAGADLNEPGHRGGQLGLEHTPLVKAVIHRREKLARELIRRGADVHAPAGHWNDRTALQAACNTPASFQFVEYLINVQRVDVNEAPSDGCFGHTALQIAVKVGSLTLVEFLLDHGADVNALSGSLNDYGGNLRDYKFPKRYDRALDVAAEHGRLDMAELLLKAGGRSSIYGLGGAIKLAKNKGHFAVASLLLGWEKQHGRRLLEQEAGWQRQHPDAARLLSELRVD